jgi:phosphatidylinositol-4,5-bisphosphate 3-kinase catalytic subunit alpha/beta/delta
LGGPGSTKYNELQELTDKAFNILRKNSNLLIILFKLMMHCGLPELTKNKDIEWIREKLVLEMTEADAAQHFCGLFIESMKNTRQMVMDAVHYWKHHT